MTSGANKGPEGSGLTFFLLKRALPLGYVLSNGKPPPTYEYRLDIFRETGGHPKGQLLAYRQHVAHTHGAPTKFLRATAKTWMDGYLAALETTW